MNQIIAIGNDTWKVPFEGGFSYHEIPWTGAGSYTDQMYDACLQVDTGPNPWGTRSHTAGLPLNWIFASKGSNPELPILMPFYDTTYRERLATNDAAGILACKPLGPWPDASSGRRPAL